MTWGTFKYCCSVSPNNHHCYSDSYEQNQTKQQILSRFYINKRFIRHRNRSVTIQNSLRIVEQTRSFCTYVRHISAVYMLNKQRSTFNLNVYELSAYFIFLSCSLVMRSVMWCSTFNTQQTIVLGLYSYLLRKHNVMAVERKKKKQNSFDAWMMTKISRELDMNTIYIWVRKTMEKRKLWCVNITWCDKCFCQNLCVTQIIWPVNRISEYSIYFFLVGCFIVLFDKIPYQRNDRCSRSLVFDSFFKRERTWIPMESGFSW